MEAIILLIDILAIVYICWRIFKIGSSPSQNDNLGIFSYQAEEKDKS